MVRAFPSVRRACARLVLRLVAAAMLVAAFVRAAAAIGRAEGHLPIRWADAALPLLFVAAAAGTLAADLLIARAAERAGPGERSYRRFDPPWGAPLAMVAAVLACWAGAARAAGAQAAGSTGGSGADALAPLAVVILLGALALLFSRRHHLSRRASAHERDEVRRQLHRELDAADGAERRTIRHDR